MFRRIAYTWELMGQSWQVLKGEKSLLLFPLLSGLCCLIVLASFALPIWAAGAWAPPGRGAQAAHQVLYYGVLFLFYVVNYFVITFFNTGIVACAIRRLRGEPASFGTGIGEALSRVHLILGWALLAASVGLVLRIIEDRSQKVGAIVAGLLGMAFSVVSFLVVPVLVVENKGPFAALKESTVLLKKTWGEQIAGSFGFGLLFGLLGVPGAGLIGVGVALAIAAHGAAAGIAGGVVVGVLGVMYLIALALVQSALQSIFQAAVYLYCHDGTAPRGFEVQALQGAMVAK